MADHKHSPEVVECALSLLLLSQNVPQISNTANLFSAMGISTWVQDWVPRKVGNAQSRNNFSTISYKGRFLCSDNSHIDRSNMRAGKEENNKLQMSLKATDGTWFHLEFPDKDEIDWSSSAFIFNANIWHNHIFQYGFGNDCVSNSRR
jgi:hypothetical protein